MTTHTEAEWDDIMSAYWTAEGGTYAGVKAAIAEHERLKEVRKATDHRASLEAGRKERERLAEIAKAQNTREYWLAIYPDGNFPLGV